jgi:hypothetical protein
MDRAPDQRFAFAFDRYAGPLLRIAGIRTETAWVSVADATLFVHFGRFRLSTGLENILDVQLTGPYSWLKTIGVHISLADKGVTFGTNSQAGVCVRFRKPVAAVLRRTGLRHPGMTVTVADPAALKSALEARITAR